MLFNFVIASASKKQIVVKTDQIDPRHTEITIAPANGTKDFCFLHSKIEINAKRKAIITIPIKIVLNNIAYKGHINSSPARKNSIKLATPIKLKTIDVTIQACGKSLPQSLGNKNIKRIPNPLKRNPKNSHKNMLLVTKDTTQPFAADF